MDVFTTRTLKKRVQRELPASVAVPTGKIMHFNRKLFHLTKAVVHLVHQCQQWAILCWVQTSQRFLPWYLNRIQQAMSHTDHTSNYYKQTAQLTCQIHSALREKCNTVTKHGELPCCLYISYVHTYSYKFQCQRCFGVGCANSSANSNY